MIVFEAAKAVLLLNPKTGTRSIVDYFSQPRFRDHANVVNGGHVPYREVINIHGKDGYQGYQLFAFYRCPIERFVSACNYIVSQWNRIWADYPLNPETKATVQAEIRDLTMEGFLDMIIHGNRGPVLDLARFQTDYFGPNIQLLNFHDFDAEFTRLTTLLGLSGPAKAPHHNERFPKFCINDLSPELIERIKQYYAPDYAFFAIRGITFNR